jgi:hypothetical protein
MTSKIADDVDYVKKITRRHVFERSEDAGITGVAISVQGRGHIMEGKPCEDYCGVKPAGKYAVFAVSDGHSSCRESESGARFAVEAALEIVERFEEKDASQEDVLRFFRNGRAYDDLLDIWFSKILEKENATAKNDIPQKERLDMAEPYGATLLAAVVCPSVIICFAIGDGGFFLLNSERVLNVMELFDFETIGDAVSTSMCDLSPDAFFSAVYPRQKFDGVMIMSDGLEKPWIDTGRFEKINELRSTVKGAEMDAMLYDFIINHAHPVESDDVSLVFGEFPPGEAFTYSGFEDGAFPDRRVLSAPKTRVSGADMYRDYVSRKQAKYLFSSAFCRKYKQRSADGQLLTKRVVGRFRRVFLPETVISLALRLCDIFEKLNGEGLTVECFDENAILYNAENDELIFDVLPALSPLDVKSRKIAEKLYIEYYAAAPINEQKNNFFLSMLLYKLIAGKTLFKDMTFDEISKRRREWSPEAESGLFGNFVENYSAAIKSGQSPVWQSPVWQSPLEWKAEIINARCVCGRGLYDTVCGFCGRKRVGVVEARSNGVSMPLSAAEYKPSFFGLPLEDRRLFKMLLGADAEGNTRRALLFALTDDVHAADGETWREITQKNSTRTSLISDITSERSAIKINGEIFDFYIPSLTPTERTEVHV